MILGTSCKDLEGLLGDFGGSSVILVGSWMLGHCWGVLGGSWRFLEGFGRRVAVLLMGSEGWAACAFWLFTSCLATPVHYWAFVPASGSQVCL